MQNNDKNLINEFLIVDNHVSKNGDVTTEFKECDGKILITQFSGINTDNFIVKKFNGKRLQFSFFKLNGIYYVNLNGHHIIDYKKFTNILKISQTDQNVTIKNAYFGDIIIPDCEIDVFKRSLTVMANFMKTKTSFFSDIYYFIFH
jgi:hypothetical protein